MKKFLLATIAAAVALAACGSAGDGSPAGGGSAGLLDRITADRPAPATDRIEVWVCAVPADTTAELYGRFPLRAALTPSGIVTAVGEGVHQYFAAQSGGRYDLHLVAGGTITMHSADTDTDCVDAALLASGKRADAVLAVATAEHVPGAPGGWGRPGSWFTCSGNCAARTTGRAAYVGASDFSADRGPQPVRDLIEHEIGHTLGLPHSGDGDTYSSALDLMSNSAAPREVDPSRLDGPDLLAIDRADLGWIPAGQIVAVQQATTITLAPASGPTNRATRLVVVPLDAHRLLTIEYLDRSGYDDHLPAAGVAIHLVSDTAGTDAGTGMSRSQTPLGSAAPHTDLLTAGASFTAEGWSISVLSVDASGARVAIGPTHG